MAIVYQTLPHNYDPKCIHEMDSVRRGSRPDWARTCSVRDYVCVSPRILFEWGSCGVLPVDTIPEPTGDTIIKLKVEGLVHFSPYFTYVMDDASDPKLSNVTSVGFNIELYYKGYKAGSHVWGRYLTGAADAGTAPLTETLHEVGTGTAWGAGYTGWITPGGFEYIEFQTTIDPILGTTWCFNIVVSQQIGLPTGGYQSHSLATGNGLNVTGIVVNWGEGKISWECPGTFKLRTGQCYLCGQGCNAEQGNFITGSFPPFAANLVVEW